eukprot:Partr_v1_DN28935_c3_g1_i7_m26211 putative Arginyl-tRNA synthetase
MIIARLRSLHHRFNPSKIQRTMTKSSFMDLSFSQTQSPLPLGILAAARIAGIRESIQVVKGSAGIALKLDASTTLKSENSILRYIARSSSASKLYPDSPLVAYHVDMWLSLVGEAYASSSATAKLTAIAEKINSKPTAVSIVPGSSEVTIADLSVWSLFRSSKTPITALKSLSQFQSWLSTMDTNPSCKATLKEFKAAAMQTASSNNFSIAPGDHPLAMFKTHISELVSKITGHPVSELINFLDSPKGPASEKADFCLAIPRLRMKGNPVQIGADIAAKMQPTDLVESIASGGPFINFKINKGILRDLLIKCALEQNVKFGTNESGKGKSMVVEFSSPNIAKPFHAGHLRPTIIGNFIRNMCIANGYKTTAINYLGDWGKQYGLLAVGYERYGNEQALVENPIKHLFEVYVQISNDKESDPEVDKLAFAYFKRMEDGDETALALWSRFRNLSIDKYKE